MGNVVGFRRKSKCSYIRNESGDIVGVSVSNKAEVFPEHDGTHRVDANPFTTLTKQEMAWICVAWLGLHEPKFLNPDVDPTDAA